MQAGRRGRVLVFRAQGGKGGEAARERGRSEPEKHEQRSKIEEKEERRREVTEGREIAYCPFLPLSLPSRLRGRCVSGRRGGSGGTARNAPFRASHLTEEPREAEEEEKGEEEEEEKEDSVCSEVGAVPFCHQHHPSF